MAWRMRANRWPSRPGGDDHQHPSSRPGSRDLVPGMVSGRLPAEAQCLRPLSACCEVAVPARDSGFPAGMTEGRGGQNDRGQSGQNDEGCAIASMAPAVVAN